MGFGRKNRGGGAKAAVVAAFLALFVQALLPAAALAGESLGGRTIEVCTDQGARKLVVGADGKARPKGFAGLPCQDCLGATLAVVFTPGLAVAPVAYAAAERPRLAEAGAVEPRARGPPRPFGQGPPRLDA